LRKKVLSILVVCLILTTALAIGTVVAEPVGKVRVMVGFKGKPDPRLIRACGGTVRYEYEIIPVIACSLPEIPDALKNDPRIAYVELDGRVRVLDELQWGVDRIDAEKVHPYNKGTGVRVAVIDTGIDYNHPDLDANVAGGASFVDYTTDYMDDHGHGTHVAGIIAAEANGVGVVGVAPEASLYALKALDSEGWGDVSDVVAALDWAVANGMQIVSMSIGTNTYSASLEDACNSAYEAGLLLVAAAGNDGYWFGNTVDYPARYESVIAVAATDQNNRRPVWSSRGPSVELAAPGVSVYSTYWDDSYVTMSGTSMACPHVSGTAALVFNSLVDPDYDLDGDGVWDASEVREKLKDTADDLGSVGWDSQYGWGLVDADEAAPPPGDTIGPSTLDAVVIPNPTGEAVSVALTATIDDSATGNSIIVGAEYFVDTVGADGTGTPMSASDGTFDSSTEGVTADIDVSGWALGDYTLYVHGKDAKDNWGSLGSVVLHVTEGVTYRMHVEGIVMLKETRWILKRAVAVVTIVDAEGSPVEGATVYGGWSGLTTESESGVTGSDGKVTFYTYWIWGRVGTCTFTVDDVSKAGWMYDSGANKETSDSIAI